MSRRPAYDDQPSPAVVSAVGASPPSRVPPAAPSHEPSFLSISESLVPFHTSAHDPSPTATSEVGAYSMLEAHTQVGAVGVDLRFVEFQIKRTFVAGEGNANGAYQIEDREGRKAIFKPQDEEGFDLKCIDVETDVDISATFPAPFPPSLAPCSSDSSAPSEHWLSPSSHHRFVQAQLGDGRIDVVEGEVDGDGEDMLSLASNSDGDPDDGSYDETDGSVDGDYCSDDGGDSIDGDSDHGDDEDEGYAEEKESVGGFSDALSCRSDEASVASASGEIDSQEHAMVLHRSASMTRLDPHHGSLSDDAGSTQLTKHTMHLNRKRKVMIRLPLRKGVVYGDAPIKEWAAYLLDHGHFAGVPRTVAATINFPSLPGALPNSTRSLTMDSDHSDEHQLAVYGPARPPSSEQFGTELAPFVQPGANGTQVVSRFGSLQEFKENIGSAEELGPAKFDVDEVHKIGILDIRVVNLDRHLGNILVTQDEHARGGSGLRLVPIDHGYILPDYRDLSDVNLEWMYWKQCKQPFSERSLAYIASLDPLRDASLLMDTGIRFESAFTCVIATLLLQRTAARGLTLFEIASMVQRSGGGEEPSTLEVIIDRCNRIIAAADKKKRQQRERRKSKSKTPRRKGCSSGRRLSQPQISLYASPSSSLPTSPSPLASLDSSSSGPLSPLSGLSPSAASSHASSSPPSSSHGMSPPHVNEARTSPPVSISIPIPIPVPSPSSSLPSSSPPSVSDFPPSPSPSSSVGSLPPRSPPFVGSPKFHEIRQRWLEREASSLASPVSSASSPASPSLSPSISASSPSVAPSSSSPKKKMQFPFTSCALPPSRASSLPAATAVGGASAFSSTLSITLPASTSASPVVSPHASVPPLPPLHPSGSPSTRLPSPSHNSVSVSNSPRVFSLSPAFQPSPPSSHVDSASTSSLSSSLASFSLSSPRHQSSSHALTPIIEEEKERGVRDVDASKQTDLQLNSSFSSPFFSSGSPPVSPALPSPSLPSLSHVSSPPMSRSFSLGSSARDGHAAPVHRHSLSSLRSTRSEEQRPICSSSRSATQPNSRSDTPNASHASNTNASNSRPATRSQSRPGSSQGGVYIQAHLSTEPPRPHSRVNAKLRANFSHVHKQYARSLPHAISPHLLQRGWEASPHSLPNSSFHFPHSPPLSQSSSPRVASAAASASSASSSSISSSSMPLPHLSYRYHEAPSSWIVDDSSVAASHKPSQSNSPPTYTRHSDLRSSFLTQPRSSLDLSSGTFDFFGQRLQHSSPPYSPLPPSDSRVTVLETPALTPMMAPAPPPDFSELSLDALGPSHAQAAAHAESDNEPGLDSRSAAAGTGSDAVPARSARSTHVRSCSISRSDFSPAPPSSFALPLSPSSSIFSSPPLAPSASAPLPPSNFSLHPTPLARNRSFDTDSDLASSSPVSNPGPQPLSPCSPSGSSASSLLNSPDSPLPHSMSQPIDILPKAASSSPLLSPSALDISSSRSIFSGLRQESRSYQPTILASMSSSSSSLAPSADTMPSPPLDPSPQASEGPSRPWSNSRLRVNRPSRLTVPSASSAVAGVSGASTSPMLSSSSPPLPPQQQMQDDIFPMFESPSRPPLPSSCSPSLDRLRLAQHRTMPASLRLPSRSHLDQNAEKDAHGEAEDGDDDATPRTRREEDKDADSSRRASVIITDDDEDFAPHRPSRSVPIPVAASSIPNLSASPSSSFSSSPSPASSSPSSYSLSGSPAIHISTSPANIAMYKRQLSAVEFPSSSSSMSSSTSTSSSFGYARYDLPPRQTRVGFSPILQSLSSTSSFAAPASSSSFSSLSSEEPRYLSSQRSFFHSSSSNSSYSSVFDARFSDRGDDLTSASSSSSSGSSSASSSSSSDSSSTGHRPAAQPWRPRFLRQQDSASANGSATQPDTLSVSPQTSLDSTESSLSSNASSTSALSTSALSSPPAAKYIPPHLRNMSSSASSSSSSSSLPSTSTSAEPLSSALGSSPSSSPASQPPSVASHPTTSFFSSSDLSFSSSSAASAFSSPAFFSPPPPSDDMAAISLTPRDTLKSYLSTLCRVIDEEVDKIMAKKAVAA